MADESGINTDSTQYKEEQDTEPKEDSVKPTPELRHFIGREVKSVKKYIIKRHEEEISKYLDVYRGFVEKVLPERVRSFDNVDVNVVYPVIKTLIPSLYFQDPKVFVKAEQEKIVINLTDPTTQMPLPPKEYSAVDSAIKFQAKLNSNIRDAKLKREMKSCLTDAELMFYGAMKCGWGNEQGVESMGAGAPPSFRDDTDMEMAYGIRLKPWQVYIDMNDFYHPEWIAIRYEVHPEQLKKDERLENTEDLKGNCEVDSKFKKEIYEAMDAADLKRTEYFEYYHKPCARYPNGIYAIFTDEVPDKFLYFGEWPYSERETRKTFPVKIIYFNEDPEGGLPAPGIRYYIQQQKAKSIMRRVMYEYIQRTLPIMAIDTTKLDDSGKQKVASGYLPRIVGTKGNPNTIFNGVSFNNLNQDFYNMDTLIDDDVAREVGTADSGGKGQNVKFAEVAKQAQANQQVRNSEKADIVRDFMIEIVKFWGGLYQEFGNDKMSTPVEDSDIPVDMGVDELQGRFKYDIKPFSMSYEDPMILRRQWLDLFNLSVAPPTAMALNSQGASIDYAKLFKRILFTYDDPETYSYLIDAASKVEAQVADALNENMQIAQGVPVEVLPTDNHMAHIMIHGTLPDSPGKLEHILMHQQKMVEQQEGFSKPGGGNQENPNGVKGVSASQEQMTQPLTPSATNSDTAMTREAMGTIGTR